MSCGHYTAQSAKVQTFVNGVQMQAFGDFPHQHSASAESVGDYGDLLIAKCGGLLHGGLLYEGPDLFGAADHQLPVNRDKASLWDCGPVLRPPAKWHS